jgi:5-methylcytosine-specific restriction endonuclease McrA
MNLKQGEETISEINYGINNLVRTAVFERDGHRCVVCNSPREIVVHYRSHQHSGNEINHLHDLTTLCSTCAMTFHGVLDSTEFNPNATGRRHP